MKQPIQAQITETAREQGEGLKITGPPRRAQLVSVVVPVCNEQDNLPLLLEKVRQNAGTLKSDFEVIAIDDGSRDGSLPLLISLREQWPFLRVLSFSRNFGHQAAVRAGLQYARGDCVISMDADLQHPPEMLPEMVAEWEQGYDVVLTRREKTEDAGWLKTLSSRMYYWLINWLSDVQIEEGSADFRLLDRKVVDVIRAAKESNLFLRGYVNWVGYRSTTLSYTARARYSGSSQYSIFKMLRLALDGITSFSTRPLILSGWLGAGLFVISLAYGLYALCVNLFTDQTVPGWTSLAMVMTFLGGIQLLMLGILGVYLGRLISQSKMRPDYLVAFDSADLPPETGDSVQKKSPATKKAL